MNGSGGSAVVIAARGAKNVMRKFFAQNKIMDDDGHGESPDGFSVENRAYFAKRTILFDLLIETVFDASNPA